MGKYAYLLVLLLMLLMSSEALCQSSEKELRLHVAPLSLLTLKTGTLQLGLQKKINNRIAFSLDYGQRVNIYKYLPDYRSNRKHYKYSKSRFELKYFLKPISKDSLVNVTPYYLSVEGLYIPQRYVKEDDWILKEDNYYKYEHSNIRRNVWVASLKFGRESRHNRITFDKYIGIGIRKLTISHETSGEVEAEYPPDPHQFITADRRQGEFYRPHLAIGFKVGYIIKE